MKRIVVTGANGLIGWHARVRLHAENCASNFAQRPLPYDVVALDRASFGDDRKLEYAVKNADAVLHFAGINRAPDDAVEAGNQAISERLVGAIQKTQSNPHLIYANSTHAVSDTPYGRGKRRASESLERSGCPYTNLILPHIFGEGARPFYNNVTATLIHQILKGETPNLNPDGRVNLLHSGQAAHIAIEAIRSEQEGTISPNGRLLGVLNLYDRLHQFHDSYQSNIYPNLASDPLDVALFNTYRFATYPNSWPRPLKLNADPRGTLFEAVKGGGGGQCFLSTTRPGVTRGDHFHLSKVERFLVIQGEGIIRMRKALTDEVFEYPVSGDAPAPVDMPTMYTHSIENIGNHDLLTLFWTHDLFDSQNPDTFADKVLI